MDETHVCYPHQSNEDAIRLERNCPVGFSSSPADNDGAPRSADLPFLDLAIQNKVASDDTFEANLARDLM